MVCGKVEDLLRPLGKWIKLLKVEKAKIIKKKTKIIQATHFKELSPFQNGDVKDDKAGLKLDEEDTILEG